MSVGKPRAVVFCAALISVAAMRAFGEMMAVGNSTFEDASSKAWRLTNGFRLEKNGGHNGSGGLVWSSAGPSAKLASAVQDVTGLRKGNTVRLSALVKTEGLKFEGYGAHVTLEMYDTEGKWIAALYSRAEGKPKDGDWALRTISGVLPSNIGRTRLAIHVAQGTVGHFAVDNVTVERVEAKPVSFVVSSAYRDTAVGGKVSFHAALDTPPEAVGQAKAVFVWQDAQGVRRRTPADEQTDDAASVTLDVGKFAKGPQKVGCGLYVGDRRIEFLPTTTLPQ